MDPNINSPEIEHDTQSTNGSSNTNMSFELENPLVSQNDEHVENEFNKPVSGYPDERVKHKPKLHVIRSRRERVIKPRQMWSPS